MRAGLAGSTVASATRAAAGDRALAPAQDGLL